MTLNEHMTLMKRILLAQGWTVIDLDDNPRGLRVRGPNWMVSKPGQDGLYYDWTEDGAWNQIFISPDDPVVSVDTAFKLPGFPPHYDRLALWREYKEELGKVMWCANYAGPTIGGALQGVADDPAVAVCLSWIAYFDKYKK